MAAQPAARSPFMINLWAPCGPLGQVGRHYSGRVTYYKIEPSSRAHGLRSNRTAGGKGVDVSW